MRLNKEIEFKPGDWVRFRGEAHYVYEVKEQSYIILPDNAFDLSDGTIYLNQALEVMKSRVEALNE